MKRIALSLLTLLLLISCTTSYVPRTFDKINIQEFEIEGVSIRAIQASDSEKVYYAGSGGNVGIKTEKGASKNTLNIKYKDSIIPNFRSLAFNGDSYFALSIANPALLYKITNDKYSLIYKEENKKVFYDSMHFFEDNIHGIAVGDPTDNCASIILTKDGGKTWNKLTCDKLPKFEEGEAFFAASNTNIKTIGSTVWVASGGKKARILKSDNFGESWVIYDTPIVQGRESQGIYSIDFADKNNGIIIGGDYSKPLENKANKGITKDGGKTWTLIADNQNPNYKSCVQYVPNTNGKEVFAVGKTGVSFSNDGGYNWKEISKEAYYVINFVDKNNAWLGGNQKIGKLVLK